MVGSFISILPFDFFAILPDSMIADPLLIFARNKLFFSDEIKLVNVIEDDFLSIIVELSKY